MFWEDNSIVIGMLQEFKKDTTGITINSEYNIFKQMRDEVDTMCDIFDSGTNLLLHSMYVVSNWKIVDFDDYDNVYVVQSLLYPIRPIRLCSEFIATIYITLTAIRFVIYHILCHPLYTFLLISVIMKRMVMTILLPLLKLCERLYSNQQVTHYVV